MEYIPSKTTCLRFRMGLDLLGLNPKNAMKLQEYGGFKCVIISFSPVKHEDVCASNLRSLE